MTRRILNRITAIAAATAFCCAAAAASESPADRLRSDLAWLAADAMAGRETGTPGHRAAAKRLAAEFRAIGLSPGAAGDWFQEAPIRLDRRRNSQARLEIAAVGGARRRLAHLEDYLIGRSQAAARFEIEAPLIFAGYGVADPVSGYDDYEAIDAAGKIVVVFDGAPRIFDTEKRAFLARSDQKRRAAEAKGAAGLISIRTVASAARTPWSRVVESAERPGATWIGRDGAAHVVAPAVAASALLSEAGAAKLFEGEQKSYAELRALETVDGAVMPKFDIGKSGRLAGASEFADLSSPNVVAMIEGRDPELRDEVVVLSAHLDHIGVSGGRARGKDRINNGALDNAMGVAILLEAARRFKSAPPRRTVLFLATTGEEMGLLGADYFARHPTVGARKIVANVNLDMPLMLYPFEDVVAFGAERSSLGAAAKDAAAAAGVRLSPDPFPEQGIFTRSDHFRFVEQGVPAIYLFSGFANGGEAVFNAFMKERYHRPSDDLDQEIDYAAAARFADLNHKIAERIADADVAPVWRDGDYFGEMFKKQPAAEAAR